MNLPLPVADRRNRAPREASVFDLQPCDENVLNTEVSRNRLCQVGGRTRKQSYDITVTLVLAKPIAEHGHQVGTNHLPVPALCKSRDIILGLAANTLTGLLGRFLDVEPTQSIPCEVPARTQKISLASKTVLAQVPGVERRRVYRQ